MIVRDLSPKLLGLGAVGALVVVVLGIVFWPRPARIHETARASGRTLELAPVDLGAAHAADVRLAPGQTALAEELLRRISAAPDDPAPRRELARLELGGGRVMKAHEQALEILKRWPEDPDAHIVEAAVRLEMGQGSQAIEHLERALVSRPRDPEALAALGKAHAGFRRWDLALKSWEEGLRAAGGRHAELERLLAQVRGKAGSVP